MKKLLAVDGNSLINRAFYGVKPLTTRDGRNTNAVFGFINMLKSHIDSVNPDYAVVVNSSGLSFLHSPTLTSIHDHRKNHSLDWMDLSRQSNVSAFEYAI